MVSIDTNSTFLRRSALHGVIKPGRFGSDRPGGPGVRLAERHPLNIVTVIAREGKLSALSLALKRAYGAAPPAPGTSENGRGVTFHWSGPDQFYAISSQSEDGSLYEDLKTRLGANASLSDQSHGRAVLVIAGPRARDVLAKGTPVDLDPVAFAPGDCAVTQMAHVGVHLAQTGQDRFELSVFRGFAESFWEWLTEMSEEFGYEVA